MKEINIAKTLINKRKEKGITQDEIADFIGVSKSSISKWETGQSYPDIVFIPQLAAYFNISIDELMGYSPQMTDMEIIRTYQKLSERFTNEDFHETLAECREIIKKYYSCFPLVMRMATLLFNYHMRLSDAEEKSALLREISDLCKRVRIESGNSSNISLTETAIMIEGYCLLLLAEPHSVLELIGEKAEPHALREMLIAQAFAAMGKPEKSKVITKGTCYCSLNNFFESATSYIGFCIDDYKNAEKFLNMALCIADITNFEKLNPNGAVLLYTNGAILHSLNDNHDKAIELLWKITDLFTKRFFPYKITGNEFFEEDVINELIDNSHIQTNIPRSEKIIKESMLNDIILNPAFAPLSENPEYKKIVEIFKKFAESESEEDNENV